jgi:hypothetical protein
LVAELAVPRTPRIRRPTRRTETFIYLAGTSALALAACGGIVNVANGGDATADAMSDGASIDGSSTDAPAGDGALMDQFIGNTYGAPPPFDARVHVDAAPDGSLPDTSPGDAERTDTGCSPACDWGCCPEFHEPMNCCPAPPYGSPPPPDPPPR